MKYDSPHNERQVQRASGGNIDNIAYLHLLNMMYDFCTTRKIEV
jgi:hypothetical protein